MHIRQDEVHAGPHDAEGTAGQHDALIVEAAHQYPGALALFRESITRRDTAVLHQDFARIRAPHAEFVELLRCRETRRAAFDDERTQAATAGARVRHRIDDHDV